MTKESTAIGIKTWPEDDRPREKLLKKGAGALSNSELLAILLRNWHPRHQRNRSSPQDSQEIRHIP